MKCLNLSNPLFKPILKRKYQNKICTNNHYIEPKKYYFNNNLTFFGNNFHNEIEINFFEPCECKIKTNQNIIFETIEYEPCECKIFSKVINVI